MGQKVHRRNTSAEEVYANLLASLTINAYALDGDTIYFACVILTKQRNSNFF